MTINTSRLLTQVDYLLVSTEAPHERLRALIHERWQGADKELAETVGISPVTLSRLVTGETDLRRSKALGAICKHLGIDEAEVLYGTPARGGGLPDAELEQLGPAAGDVEAILAWLPADMSRRWTSAVSTRDRLGEVYAYGVRHGWSRDRLDYIHKTLDRLETI